MKYLSVLAVLQLLATLCLLYMVLGMAQEQDVQRDALSSIRQPGYTNETDDHAPVQLDPSLETKLRQIISEQLAAYELTRADEKINKSRQPSANRSPDNDTADRVEAIENDLEYYFSVGSISENEMAKLQTKIARLDKNNRTAMLRKLVKAMNEGRIEGQL